MICLVLTFQTTSNVSGLRDVDGLYGVSSVLSDNTNQSKMALQGNVSSFLPTPSKEEISKMFSHEITEKNATVLTSNRTSIHTLIRLLNGSTIDTVINFKPNVNYVPNERDLEMAKNTGVPIYNIHINSSGNFTSPNIINDLQVVGTYFIPYEVLPEDLVKKMKTLKQSSDNTGIIPSTFDHNPFIQTANAQGPIGVVVTWVAKYFPYKPMTGAAFAGSLLLSLDIIRDATKDFARLHDIALRPGIDQTQLRNVFLQVYGLYLLRAAIGFAPLFIAGGLPLTLIAYISGKAVGFLLKNIIDSFDKISFNCPSAAIVELIVACNNIKKALEENQAKTSDAIIDACKNLEDALKGKTTNRGNIQCN